MQKCKNYHLEAGEGIEPSHSGFADRCLTTWLTRHKKEVKRIQAFLERLVSYPLEDVLVNSHGGIRTHISSLTNLCNSYSQHSF